MKAKLAQANFVLGLTVVFVFIVLSFYFYLFRNLDKSHIDNLLVKSLSSFVEESSIRYSRSDLKIRNFITYTVYDLSIKNEFIELHADKMRFDIPLLALLSRRRIRSHIGRLNIFIRKLQDDGLAVSVLNSKKTLDNELSVQIDELNVTQKGLTYHLRDTYLRNINHPFYTTLKTYISLSKAPESNIGLEFWGEIKFKDIFKQRINLNGFMQVKSNDSRFKSLVGRQISIESDKKKKNLFSLSKKSGKASLSFYMQLKSDSLRFYDLDLEQIVLSKIPSPVLSLVGCEQEKYNISGEITWNKFSEAWEPLIQLEGKCQTINLNYHQGHYVWKFVSNDKNYPYAYAESSNIKIESTQELQIDIKNLDPFKKLSFLDNLKKIKEDVLGEIPSVMTEQYLKVIIRNGLEKLKKINYQCSYSLLFKNQASLREEVYLKRGKTSLIATINNRLTRLRGETNDIKLLEYLTGKSFSFIRKARLIELDLNHLKKELVIKVHKGKVDLDLFKKNFGKSLDLVMLGSNDRLEIESKDMKKYNFDIFKGKL